MPSARLNEWFGTLRFRLSAWNTAVVVVTVLLALIAVREGLRYTLIREADQLLLEDLAEMALAMEESYPDVEQIHEQMNRKAKGHEQRSLFVQILDEQGEDVWSSIHTPEAVLRRSDLPANAAPQTIEGYRIAQRTVASSDLSAATLRVGTSLAYVEDDIAKLTQLMLVVGAALLIAAPLGGYWLAGRATQPLGEIIHTAANLHPSQLDERLPLRHSGDELDQLSATINGLLDRVADYLARNRELTANAAHELRSPLAAIRSTVEVALNSTRTPQEYQDLLCDIIEQTSDLSHLVNQLLLLAETDSADARTRKEPVRLDHLVARAVDMFHGVAEERGIDLSTGPLVPLTVPGDSGRLREVVNNLIDNSLKFTAAGGAVSLELHSDGDTQLARLRVTDTGTGIAREELPHIFERFYRGDRARSRESSTRGNGLGLSICKAVVEAHGGRIEVQSTPGEGTAFCVYLPSQPTAVPEKQCVGGGFA
jgi:heavy metal sensor kinase